MEVTLVQPYPWKQSSVDYLIYMEVVAPKLHPLFPLTREKLVTEKMKFSVLEEAKKSADFLEIIEDLGDNAKFVCIYLNETPASFQFGIGVYANTEKKSKGLRGTRGAGFPKPARPRAR